MDGTVDADVVVPRVCETVAETAGTDPATMSPPLFEVVDPDALARVVESDGVNEISFEYAGYRVRIGGDGTVSID